MIPRVAICIFAVATFFIVPHVLAEYHLFQVCLIAATALVVLGLVVVTGLAGQISLAQSAFVGLGGYGSAILATSWGMPLWAGIPLTAFLVSLAGVVLGLLTLRISGHYLALATMAFAAIVAFVCVPAVPAWANISNLAAKANRGIDRCGAKAQGQALIDCVGNVMSNFAQSVGADPRDRRRMPEILNATVEASGIRGRPKAEAHTVLERVVGVMRGLATSGAGDFAPAYRSVSDTFARAIRMIDSKG